MRDVICIAAGLFILGVAGGLEKGMISVGGALLAWAAAASVIAITILAGRRRHNG